MENKLKDNEIIKALECCSMGSYPACRDCPYHDDYVNRGCINKRNADIKDLINRQKAEKTELQHKISELEAEVEKLNVELVGMRGACESYKMHYDNAQEKIKALKEALDGETVKVMRIEHEVERVKGDLAFREKQLYNLAKEMEGADK